jgi:hypothetical protein
MQDWNYIYMYKNFQDRIVRVNVAASMIYYVTNIVCPGQTDGRSHTSKPFHTIDI